LRLGAGAIYGYYSVMELEISYKEVTSEIVVIKCIGENDVYTSPALHKVIIDLVNSSHSRLVFDLTKLEYMDSTGLGVLVGALKRAHSRGGWVFLTVDTERIMKYFRITGLVRIFWVFDSLSEALLAASKYPLGVHPASTSIEDIDEIGWHWFPARIYTSETSAGAAVQESLAALAEAFAMEVAYESDVERSSWFREYILRMKDSTALPTRDETLSLLQRALAQHAFDMPQAQIDVTQSQAVAYLLNALDKTPNAVIQVGSVLVIKVRDTTIVRNLTQLELAHWERNPGLFRDPEMALHELQRASDPVVVTKIYDESESPSA
jgi:anti-anti-sigma factor